MAVSLLCTCVSCYVESKNSPAVKKCVASKKAIVKKDVKSKVAANKWL